MPSLIQRGLDEAEGPASVAQNSVAQKEPLGTNKLSGEEILRECLRHSEKWNHGLATMEEANHHSASY